MAVPVIQSSNTSTGSSTASLVITKPTGLAVGDLLFVDLAMYDQANSNRTFSTPAGWTVISGSLTGSSSYLVRTKAFYKIADSGDVAASNFTFSISGSVGFVAGYLGRATGQIPSSPITIMESDESASSLTSLSYTTALTPVNVSGLLVFGFAVTNVTGTPSTFSSYASTPSSTWTEIADFGVGNGSNGDIGLGIASSSYASLSQITNRSVTLNVTSTQHASTAFIITGIQNATGTNALHSVSPTHFNQAGVAGATGTNTLLSVSPTMFDQSGKGLSPTQWTNEAKPSTSWTNETP